MRYCRFPEKAALQTWQKDVLDVGEGEADALDTAWPTRGVKIGFSGETCGVVQVLLLADVF